MKVFHWKLCAVAFVRKELENTSRLFSRIKLDEALRIIALAYNISGKLGLYYYDKRGLGILLRLSTMEMLKWTKRKLKKEKKR